MEELVADTYSRLINNIRKREICVANIFVRRDALDERLQRDKLADKCLSLFNFMLGYAFKVSMYTWPSAMLVLCVFEGILNKAEGIWYSEFRLFFHKRRTRGVRRVYQRTS